MARFHPNNIISIIIVILIFGMAIIVINLIDDFKSTRDELTIFYRTSFDNCTLTTLVKKKYPGRGDYSVFYTDCSPNHFPILLEKK
jgi:hypothetical protein